MRKFILAIDQGTTSTRAVIVDSHSVVVSTSQKETLQSYPKTGWVEQDAMEILQNMIETFQTAITKAEVSLSEIVAIGITNQRETTVIWNKNTGKPIYPAIIWQSRQSIEICNEWKTKGLEKKVKQATGLTIDAYFSASKIVWILDNVNGVREMAEAGELLFGTIDTWIIWNLTGRKTHATDFSNASRTMLFNINSLQWEDSLIEAFNIPKMLLPKVLNSIDNYGNVDEAQFGFAAPIYAVAGDQQSALFGQTCFEKGSIKNTYGTGCFLLMNIGKTPIYSNKGLLTSIAWGINGEITYALEGSVFVAGAAIQWLRDSLGIIKDASETELMAESLENNEGVYFVPAFVGLGTPHWKSDVKGAFFGLTRGTTKAHLVRAALEAMCYQTTDLVKVMANETKIPITNVLVDGGATCNNFLMQFQSDMLYCSVIRPQNLESTVKGIALMAGIGAGIITSLEECKSLIKVDRVFEPSLTAAEREKYLNGWQDAVKATIANHS
jgi:glycerol kinase